MLRSTLSLLLFATIQVETQAQITHRIDRWGNISVAAIDTDVYWVTKNRSHINIYSNKDSYEDDECDLELDESHVGNIQVAAIERKILLLYWHNSTSLRILQLDPFLCSYVPLPSIKTSVASTMDPQLVVANNSLNVFLRGASDCLPCRLDVNGNQLKVSGQLEQGNNILVKSFILKEFVQGNNGLNYAFAANFKNGSSVLRRLDHYFNTVDEVYFKYHQIENIAVKWGPVKTWIGITYAGLGSPHERILALYTGTLKLLFETRTVYYPGDKFVDTMLSINSAGQSIIHSVQAQQSLPQPYRRWFYAIYSSNGQLVRFGYVYGRFQKYNWQMFRRCDEGICEDDVCLVLNHSYELYTRSIMSCY